MNLQDILSKVDEATLKVKEIEGYTGPWKSSNLGLLHYWKKRLAHYMTMYENFGRGTITKINTDVGVIYYTNVLATEALAHAKICLKAVSIYSVQEILTVFPTKEDIA